MRKSLIIMIILASMNAIAGKSTNVHTIHTKPISFGPFAQQTAKDYCEDAASMIRTMSTKQITFLTTCTQIGKPSFWSDEVIYVLTTEAFIRYSI